MQGRGTGRVGAFFGPIILVWFVALTAVGIARIAEHPGVLAAFNPIHGLTFLLQNGLIGFTVLGLVFLAVTGSETLYADLGHFGRLPIQAAWLGVASPEAYERLLLDCVLGDSTLYARRDMTERGWEIVMPILEAWQDSKPDFPNHESGTWGPKAADELLEKDGRRWRRP